ncbi:sulfite oxidase-like [Saccoglossus kowalevskii]|uniref:sulfite oxidase n=1 Tax=Saccoglossus kowalevskii TaxID=10224 RepID=A0ABM0GNX5_SACKO|nr:PREDICTED: sulfite oxidase, mitochondrial-like isoform X1 [Saccoglossus kowalevskii]XP_006815733.1 PREDICTED: sulfite oxidase, mitochondrial-like isoform X2 [Saccoglossus kowalevskii]XP_006815734.1 PREDICTED: sulfite oxidase, mitochondrial-like isoform X3 [Saccoglossus kowalevskii]
MATSGTTNMLGVLVRSGVNVRTVTKQPYVASSASYRYVTTALSRGDQTTTDGLICNPVNRNNWHKNGRSQYSTGGTQKTKFGPLIGAAAAAAFAGIGVVAYWRSNYTHAGTKKSIQHAVQVLPAEDTKMVIHPKKIKSHAGNAGKAIPGIPEYTATEVARHDDPNRGIWMTYKDAVYDVTEFITAHPGGDRIMMAAGGGLEPFWEVFEIHQNAKVFEQLELYRIGNLAKEGRKEYTPDPNNPFANDPLRHPAIIPSSKRPFNGEPPSDLLIEKFSTPQQLFYVRNHLPVPDIDPNNYSLEVTFEDDDEGTVEFSLKDLKKFRKSSVTATLQCAGNRRSEMNEYKTVKGLSWKQSAIGNATFTGVKLRDVLMFVGFKESDPSYKGKHVQFEGLDIDPFTSEQYGASIPLVKALDPEGDVLLAWEMNGEPLTRDHGFPVRVVVPGFVGARNVKWLGRITISDEESQSHWQQNDYKGFSPEVTLETADYSKQAPIQEYPVQSAVCVPVNGSTISSKDEEITVKGYAWSGGGRGIFRVDVSLDGGKTWFEALLKQEKRTFNRNWAWTIWHVTLPIPKNHNGELDIVCKAVDSAYNVQPNTFHGHWNFRGVLANAWSHSQVKIE